MKLIPYARRAIAASLVLAATALSHAASYTITTAPGWNLIANQLDNAKDNGIRNVIPSAPIGSQIRHYDLATKTLNPTETFQIGITGGSTWQPGTNILNPGDGLLFFNPTTTNVVLTISGNPHIPTLPISIGASIALVGRQTNATALVTDILGFTQPNLTAVYRFITGAGHDPLDFASSNFTAYAFVNGNWTATPGVPPAFRVGESVWITTNGVLPTFRAQPKSQTNCPGSPLIVNVSASGTPPLSFQWTLNGNPIPGATLNSYTNPTPTTASSGAYICRVTNPFGTVPSNPATILIQDNVPPTITCPSNIVTSCRGLGGTAVQFGAVVTDNCDPSPTVTYNPPSGSTFHSGVTTVVVVARDASGNTNTCSFTVTVLDDISPQITCPPDKVVVARDPKGAQVFFTVDASDNCDPNPKIDSNPPSGSVFPPGITVVTSKVTDSAGNSATCTFNVIVLDSSCCDGKTWSQKDVSSPGGRFGHVMAFDSNRGKVVMFGGENPNGVQGDTWEWNGSAWTQIPAEGPAPRSQAAMTFDSRIGVVVMHGGRNANGAPLDDTWFWDGSKWQRVSIPSVGARYGHAMAFDSSRNVTVLYGGVDANAKELNDTWEFDGSKWQQVAGGTTGPGPLQGHGMAYGSAQDQLLLFGGSAAGKVSGETWQWNGEKRSWNRIASTGPSARAFHGMTYSDNCDAIIVFGGGASTPFAFADTWEWNGAAWKQTAAQQPTARGMTAMAHDSARNQTVLLGGTRTTKEWFGDTWVYSLDSTPPQVVSVDAVCGEGVVLIAFNNPVSAASAGNRANYTINCGVSSTGGGTANPIVTAALTDDPRIVRITTANPIIGGCTLVIGLIQDACGRTLRGFQTTIDCRPDPCGKGSSGNEYWLTFPGNYAIDPTNRPLPKVFMTGAAGTIGTVTMANPAFSVPFTIPAVGITQVTLPTEADLGDDLDLVKTNAVHIIASKPVAVYGLNHIPYTTDAYLGLSTRGIGKSYMVMAYGNLLTNVPELNGTQFAIAATADNTTVIISPATAVSGHPAGVPFAVQLMQGQTYQLRGTNDAPSDLTGSIIAADKPISVFGGHRSGTIPTSDVFFADHIVEQMPPTDMWGQQFLTVPLATRNGDTYRVMALIDGTKVTTNGVALGGLINRGKFIEYRASVAVAVSADKPVLLAQFSNSSDYDAVVNSDPFMVIVPPLNSYSSSYLIPSGGTNFASNFINLTVPNANVAQVTVDGVAIAAGSFTAIGASGFSGGKIAVSAAGPHRVLITSGANFGLIAYGWSLYNAYGFAGQSCGGGSQITPPRFTCPPESTTIQAGAGCLGIVPDLGKAVGNGDQALTIRQQPPAGSLLPPGNYPVRLTIVDSVGNSQTCSSVLIVTPSATSGLQCPLDIVTNCSPAGGQVVTFTPSVCNTNFTVTTQPASGSVFPAGVTTVVVTAKNANGLTETCSFKVTVNCDVKLQLGAVSPSNFTINWSGAAFLEHAATINGPWSRVQDATPPFQIKPTNSANFFRLVQ